MLKFSYFTVISIAFLAFAFFAAGSSPFDITFPIPELGNCADKNACKAFCDDFTNKDACVEFAQKHGLVDEHAAETAKKLPPTGPGGCKGETECRSYCEDPAHLDECLVFAEEHGLVSQEEIKRAKEFAGQTGPGGCRGANECRAYCEDPGHKEECLEFAHRKGLISDRDREAAQRVLKEGGPGGCRSEKECRAYCEDPAHIEECLSFGERHGVVPPEEVKRIKKLALAGGPGGCRGETECRNFCENPANQPACIDWAVSNGLMSEEEARFARKIAGKTGPGGCTGEQCRDFCENPQNAESCLEFAEREGILPPEELQRARKFLKATQEGGPGGCRGIECRNYCEDPAHQEECFSFAKGQGLLPPGAEKDFETGQKILKKVKESGGPGGCRDDRECQVYCSDPSHVEECAAFGAAHGGIPEEEVRRMLKDFQGQRFEIHGDFRPPENFRRFEEEARKRFEEFRQLEEHFRGGPGFGPPGGFPGGPAEFQGGPPQGGFPGGSGFEFKGPGGCSSPAECIKYCSEHKEECFSFGPPGAPGARPSQGGIPPGHDFPQIRGGLIRDLSGFSFRKKETGRYELLINDSDGIQEFSLDPSSGSPYGGGISCNKEYRTDVAFPPSAFPISAFYVDCAGNRTEKTFSQDSPAGDAIKPPEFPEGRSQDIFKNFPSNGPIPGTPGIFGPFPEPPHNGIPFEGLGPIPGTPGILPREHPPEGFPPAGFCPALPTVDSCPSGQKRIVTFSSPECGTFYTCVPEEFGGTALPSAETHTEPSPPPAEPTSLPPPPPPPPPTFDPATTCTQQGGTWDGSNCVFPSPPPPPPTTADPATQCTQEGGTWNGSYCQFPEGRTEPPHSQASSKGFFATILDFFR